MTVQRELAKGRHSAGWYYAAWTAHSWSGVFSGCLRDQHRVRQACALNDYDRLQVASARTREASRPSSACRHAETIAVRLGADTVEYRDLRTTSSSIWAWRVGLRGTVAKAESAIDFQLTVNKDRAAALRFRRKATNNYDVPTKVTIDDSGANATAIIHNAKHNANLETRQAKYLNNIVEREHRAIKRPVRPIMGLKSFWSGAAIRAGIARMHMIRKAQLMAAGRLSPASPPQPAAFWISISFWQH